MNFLVLPCLLALCCCTAVAESSLPLRIDFSLLPDGPVSVHTLRQHVTGLKWSKIHERSKVLQANAEPTSKYLRMDYPAGGVGPQQSGGQFLVGLPPSEELWLTYELRFDQNFDFRKGGKLPGLTSGGSKYTGGTIPSKGQGWSARYMWKADGKAIVYLYTVDMPSKWGESLPLEGVQFQPQRWHRLTQRIRLNSGDAFNGILEVWFDEMLVLQRDDIRFRLGDKGRIDSFYFSTFHGGNTPDWAPKRDSSAGFRNFTISQSPDQ